MFQVILPSTEFPLSRVSGPVGASAAEARIVDLESGHTVTGQWSAESDKQRLEAEPQLFPKKPFLIASEYVLTSSCATCGGCSPFRHVRCVAPPYDAEKYEPTLHRAIIEVMRMPKLVTFDVYMALLDIEGSLTPVASETFSLPEDTAKAFVRTWRAKQMERAAISNSLGKGRTTFRAATAMGLDYASGNLGIEVEPETREQLLAAWDRLAPWPEANAVVAAVKDMGYPTAILSNGDRDMLKAAAEAFDASFDHILSSEQAGFYKPHPAVYALPETELGIPANDVLHVAGSPNDVLGAVAAGVACLWSNRHGDRLLDPAYPPAREYADLNGVLNYLGECQAAG